MCERESTRERHRESTSEREKEREREKEKETTNDNAISQNKKASANSKGCRYVRMSDVTTYCSTRCRA